MEDLVKNNIFFLYTVTILYIAITGIKLTERARITLVYVFSFILALIGSVRKPYIIFGATAVLFITLEILSDDRKKIQLFTSLRYKATDFLYRLFVEYQYHYFLLAIACLAFRWAAPLNYILSGIFILSAAILLMSQKYSTMPITEIIDRLKSTMPMYDLEVNDALRRKFAMLTHMEDRTYFSRKEKQHTIPFNVIARKGFAYLRVYKGSSALRGLGDLFSRGYGTIEMQLIRSIGIESGYDTHKYRRKIFEFIYANMVLNGYRDYLERSGIDCREYRSFILWHYIENVQIKVNDKRYYAGERSSLLQLFGESDINQITDEEFFIWCMGLPQWQKIGPIALGLYAPVMREFAIDESVVRHKLDVLSAQG